MLMRDQVVQVQEMIEGALRKIEKDEPFDSTPLESKLKGFDERLKAIESAVKGLSEKKETKRQR